MIKNKVITQEQLVQLLQKQNKLVSGLLDERDDRSKVVNLDELQKQINEENVESILLMKLIYFTEGKIKLDEII